MSPPKPENLETPSTPPDNETVIKSLWLKENTWERLGIVKNSFNLTWSEFFELLLHHLQQSGYIPKEAQTLLQEIPGDSLEHTLFQKNVLQLGPPPWEASRLLSQLESEVQLLNLNLEHLISSVEDHAESLIALPPSTTLDPQ
jgi:hypothetical protein